MCHSSELDLMIGLQEEWKYRKCNSFTTAVRIQVLNWQWVKLISYYAWHNRITAAH